MAQEFIIPTLFHAFIGIWYYTLMSEMDELQSVPLHVFCVLGRVFYGMCQSFPFDTVTHVSLARMLLWIAVLLFVLDILQLVSIFSQFNSYTLTDSLSILFSVIFIASDLLFILQLYKHSTSVKLELEEKGAQQQPSRLPERNTPEQRRSPEPDRSRGGEEEVILTEVLDDNELRRRINQIQF